MCDVRFLMTSPKSKLFTYIHIPGELYHKLTTAWQTVSSNKKLQLYQRKGWNGCTYDHLKSQAQNQKTQFVSREAYCRRLNQVLIPNYILLTFTSI